MTEERALSLVGERVSHDSVLRHVWTQGETYALLEITASGTRTLWMVGPRGGINRAWTYPADLWEALQ